MLILTDSEAKVNQFYIFIVNNHIRSSDPCGIGTKKALEVYSRASWWEQRESNPRPSACKADALNQLSYAPVSFLFADNCVRLRIFSRSLPQGNSLLQSLSSLFSTKININIFAVRTGLEPATPGVTGRYSNQLNYRTNSQMF